MQTVKARLIAVIGAAVLLMSWPGVSGATTVERLTLEVMTSKARAIVIGTVRESRTHWSTDGRLILTTHTIAVDEAIKGSAGRLIEVTTIGGQVGDVVLHVAGMPVFTDGESAVVFIEQTGSFSTVVGLGQGKFTVRGDEVANSVSDLTFPDGGRPSPLKMPLKAFKAQIRSIVDRQP